MNTPHLLMSWDELAALCRDLAIHVARSYQPDVVVGIARVGTLPGALIALILRAEFHSVRVPSGDRSMEVRPYLPAPESVARRRVLLVDEVSHSGAAMRWAEHALRRLGAAEVRTLVLFAAPGAAPADYAGPEVSAIVLQPWIREVALADRELLAPPGPPMRVLPGGRGS